MGIRIGISGWRYPRWRGRFYPPGLPQREELAYAARCFPSIELNGSFYSLQRPQSWQAWHDDTPARFVFAVKGPRFITHTKRLRDCAKPWPTSSRPDCSRWARSWDRSCGSCRRR